MIVKNYTNKLMKNQIKMNADHLKVLAEELEVTTQTVRMALGYVYNSPIAQKIRKRAKELLIEEANKVKIEY